VDQRVRKDVILHDRIERRLGIRVDGDRPVLTKVNDSRAGNAMSQGNQNKEH